MNPKHFLNDMTYTPLTAKGTWSKIWTMKVRRRGKKPNFLLHWAIPQVTFNKSILVGDTYNVAYCFYQIKTKGIEIPTLFSVPFVPRTSTH